VAGIKAIEIRQINLFKSGGSSRLVNVRVTDFILTIIWGGIITSNVCGEHNKDNVKNKIILIWFNTNNNPTESKITNLCYPSIAGLYLRELQKIKLGKAKGF